MRKNKKKRWSFRFHHSTPPLLCQFGLDGGCCCIGWSKLQQWRRLVWGFFLCLFVGDFVTHRKFNIHRPWRYTVPKRKASSSNHHFSGALAVKLSGVYGLDPMLNQKSANLEFAVCFLGVCLCWFGVCCLMLMFLTDSIDHGTLNHH